MWKIILTLSILITIFWLNLGFYYFNDDYRFFIKKIKNPESTIYTDNNINIDDNNLKIDDNWVTPNLSLEISEETSINEVNETLENNWVTVSVSTIDEKWSFWFWQDYTEHKTEELVNANSWELDTESDIEVEEVEKKVILSDIWEELLDKFSSFKLTKAEIHSSLFDITTEYPDDYIEYISKDFIFYYFPTRNYDTIVDIFEAISFDLPFSINKLNNFFWNSFYINIDEEVSDDFVRIVFDYKSNVFWLKIKKDSYNDVKTILDTIK